MCGIAGILNLSEASPPSQDLLQGMLAQIRHRGPDEFGLYLDDRVALGNARLSIIDLSGGQQPVANEDQTLWIVFNGEIFNYVELRPELEARGHRFSTNSDTEVLLHAYEEYGPACLARLNGQFAFAVWNTKDRSLFIARDRLGVRPLFYTQHAGRLLFGSEIKAIFADRSVPTEIDPAVLDQVFTFWSPLAPRSIFRGIEQLPPGHYLEARNGTISIHNYWKPAFPDAHAAYSERTEPEYLEELAALLIDAARIRLRADVPVGAYLSGGLDSSTIAAIIRNYTPNRLETFSISFSDTTFDESAHQLKMADFLGTKHNVVNATHADIGDAFPDVIWHTEAPLMRTSPAPMFLLSKLVRDSGYKVVLTGEGADEFLGGYDIFKEAKIRRFWAQQPDSTWRPLLLKRLYADIPGVAGGNLSFLTAFFRQGLSETNHPAYSHALRWRNGRRSTRFFSGAVKHTLADQQTQTIDQVFYPPDFKSWDSLAQAQYLEISVFLSQYLLCSQGDRVSMAHSIEGRFPFLDYRLIEFCNRLPSRLKLRGLNEKYLLKKLASRWLPAEITRRRKQPYRSPIHRSFFNDRTPAYVGELLSPEGLRGSGLFDPGAVGLLAKKAETGSLGETDDMAIAGIISTQLLHHQFISHRRPVAKLPEGVSVKTCRGNQRLPKG
jgi:asparagine synthase (glutamine-hydrolysing)